MLLTEFKAILLTADPACTHYKGSGAQNYTVWNEYGENAIQGDNLRQETAWKIQVDRFTKTENDTVAEAIRAALERDDIASEYTVDYETDTGYIHHIWTCEAV